MSISRRQNHRSGPNIPQQHSPAVVRLPRTQTPVLPRSVKPAKNEASTPAQNLPGRRSRRHGYRGGGSRSKVNGKGKTQERREHAFPFPCGGGRSGMKVTGKGKTQKRKEGKRGRRPGRAKGKGKNAFPPLERAGAISPLPGKSGPYFAFPSCLDPHEPAPRVLMQQKAEAKERPKQESHHSRAEIAPRLSALMAEGGMAGRERAK